MNKQIRRPSGVLDPQYLDSFVFLVSKILRDAPSPQKLVTLANSRRKANDFFRLFGVPGHPLGASGPPYLPIFHICFAISAVFFTKSQPQAT